MAIQRRVWSISLPPKMEKEIAKLAKQEEKTKSELIRDAMRLYMEKKAGNQFPYTAPTLEKETLPV